MQASTEIQRSPLRIKFLVLLLITCSGLGGILYGYDIGVISGALLFIKHSIPMTDTQMGLIVGAVLAGGLVGTLATGILADRFGRRRMIIAACLIFFVGVFIILNTHTYSALLIARLLLGIGVGVVSVAIPLYIAEIAPAKIRGKSVTVFQLFLTFGILLAYVIDWVFADSGNWRGMFAIILIPTTILFISMFCLPESPRWLIAQNKTKAAFKILRKIRAPEMIEQEAAEMTESLKEEVGGWRELFSRSLIWPLFISLSVAICNQLTGINVFLQYAPTMLHQAGFNSSSIAMLGTVGIGLVNFLATLLALAWIDRFGRKRLLVLGTAGIIIAELFLGIVMSLHFNHQLQALLSLFGFLLFIFSFAIGPGVVVWLAISELYPTKVRGKGVALCLFINTLVASVLSTVFLDLVRAISLGYTYWLFALFTVYYFIVARFMLPETKQETLEAIQKKLHT